MKRLVFFSLVAVLLIGACSPALQSEGARGMDFGGGAPVAPAIPEMDEAWEQSPEEPASSDSGGGAQPASIERLVIQNADMSIVVDDVEARLRAVQAMAVELGGYVVSSQKFQTHTENGTQIPQAQVTIRVPSDRLDEALAAIKKDVVEVTNEQRSGQDVTAEYVDLQSRLKNLEATEAQLVKIMETATETKDVLEVFNQLTSIREQIEVTRGQMKYYEESAAMSAVSVNIMAEETLQPLQIAGWEPQGTARDAIQSLIYFVQDFVDLLIRLVLLVLPALVLIAIPVYLAFLALRAVARRMRKPRVQPEPVEEAKK